MENLILSENVMSDLNLRQFSMSEVLDSPYSKVRYQIT